MTRPAFDALLVTCEHATNAVPKAFKQAFTAAPSVLKTHRAWDPGAALLARRISEQFGAPVFYGQITRLLVDLNRRDNSRRVFSEFTPAESRQSLLDQYHRPWRSSVLQAARALLKQGKLLHVSCHSFTPVWDGQERRVDIGLLFDSRRRLESETATGLQARLRTALLDLRVRRNNPYRGISDGMTTWLRDRLPLGRYAGLEIEINQRLTGKGFARLCTDIAGSIRPLLAF